MFVLLRILIVKLIYKFIDITNINICRKRTIDLFKITIFLTFSYILKF